MPWKYGDLTGASVMTYANNQIMNPTKEMPKLSRVFQLPSNYNVKTALESLTGNMSPQEKQTFLGKYSNNVPNPTQMYQVNGQTYYVW